MERRTFNRKIRHAKKQVDELLRQAAIPGKLRLQLPKMLEHLQGALEELHVADEELRAQNQELAEERLAREKETRAYQELFDFAPDGYLVTDKHGNIIEANRAALKLLEVNVTNIVGKPLLVFVSIGDRKAFREHLLRMTIPQPSHHEWEFTLKPRRSPPFSAAITGAVVSVGGKVTGLRWLIRDITSRKLREEALRESDERFRVLVEGVKDYAIFMVNPRGRVASWNIGAERITGYHADEVIGRHHSIFSTPEDIKAGKPEEELKAALAKGMFETEFWQVQQNGSRYIASVVTTALHNDNGKLYGFVKVVRDVTERKRAEQALREMAARLRVIIDEIPAILWTTDTDLRFTSCLGRGLEMLKLRPDQLIGMTIMEYLKDGDTEGVIKSHRQALTEKPIDFEVKWMGRNFQCHVEPLNNREGAVIGCIGIALDITERTRALEAVRTSETMFERLFESSPDGIVVADGEGCIQQVNSQTEKLFGYKRDELAGKPVEILVPQHLHKRHAKHRRGYVAGPRVRAMGEGLPLLGRRKDGSEFPVDILLSPLQINREMRVLAVIRDVTVRKRLEAEVVQISDWEKRRLGQDLHDGLSQQLAGITYLTNSLRTELAQAPGKTAAGAARIHELLLTTMDQARSLAHGLSPVKAEASGLRMALQELAVYINGVYKISCSFVYSPHALVNDNAAAEHVYRIAQEAVHNALKHGKANRVAISLTRENGVITLTVKDNGRGLPDRRPKDGGMGMEIMNYRARMIGATLHIRRTGKSGTMVICSLPVKASQPTRVTP